MEYLKMIEEWRDVLPPYYFNLMVMGMKVTVEEKNFHQTAVITPENPPPVVEGSLSTKEGIPSGEEGSVPQTSVITPKNPSPVVEGSLSTNEGIPLGEEGRTPTLPSEPSSQSKKTNVFAWLVILHDLNSPPNLPFFLCNPRSNSLLSLEKCNEDSLLRPPPEPPPLLLYFLLLPTPNPHSSASTLDYSVPLPLPMHPSKHLTHISTTFPQMILLCVKSESLRGGEGKRRKIGICWGGGGGGGGGGEVLWEEIIHCGGDLFSLLRRSSDFISLPLVQYFSPFPRKCRSMGFVIISSPFSKRFCP